FAVFSCLFGLVIGSFLNVVIYRLPRGRSIVAPRSACTGCGKLIAWYDNIPVLSWIMLGGKCRHCKTRISPRYAAVEALTGCLFLFTFLTFGFMPASLKGFVFIGLLVPLIFIDAEHRLL